VARHEGQVVFVPFTAPAETVRVVLTERHKTFARGRVVEMVTPSPDRVVPPCPLFTECGGCATQHLAYPAETKIKVGQIEAALKRIGKISDPVLRPILTGPEYGYRNRITVHNREGKVGFLGTDGRTLVDVKRCLLAAEDVNAKLTHLRSRPRPRPHYSVRAEEVRGEAFYQSNRPLAEPLKQLVVGAVPAEVKTVLEGYAGTGFFSGALVAAGKKVVAVESHPAAVEVFRKEVPEADLLEGRFEDEMEAALGRMGKGPAVCLINPPRGGLSPDARKLLAKARPFLGILYLSCDPPALARDVAALGEFWKPEWFQPVDLFPRTAHVECLGWLASRLSPENSRQGFAVG
jgi:23S rRNA (uracil1939-C5)-methyltransferase